MSSSKTKFPLKIKKLKKISIKNDVKYDIKMLKQITNKRGEIQQKNYRVMNKQIDKGVKFQDISDKYKNLVQDGLDPRNIVITAKNLNGNWKTLKSKSYSAKSLKCDQEDNENYFDSMPSDKIEELTQNYYSVDIIIY
jgi:hypothetical protein